MTDEPHKPMPTPEPTSTPPPIISQGTGPAEAKPGDEEPIDSEAK